MHNNEHNVIYSCIGVDLECVCQSEWTKENNFNSNNNNSKWKATNKKTHPNREKKRDGFNKGTTTILEDIFK